MSLRTDINPNGIPLIAPRMAGQSKQLPPEILADLLAYKLCELRYCRMVMTPAQVAEVEDAMQDIPHPLGFGTPRN